MVRIDTKIYIYLALDKVAEGREAVNVSSAQGFIKNHNKDTLVQRKRLSIDF